LLDSSQLLGEKSAVRL